MKVSKRIMSVGLVAVVLGGMLVGCDDGEDYPSKEDEQTSQEETTETEDVETNIEDENEEVEEIEEKEVKLFEDDKVEISFLRVTPEGIEFMIVNKTDIVVTIQADTLSVNGLNISDIIMSPQISPQSKGKVLAEGVIDNHDEHIETISGQLRVIDFEDNWEDYPATFTDVKVD